MNDELHFESLLESHIEETKDNQDHIEETYMVMNPINYNFKEHFVQFGRNLDEKENGRESFGFESNLGSTPKRLRSVSSSSSSANPKIQHILNSEQQRKEKHFCFWTVPLAVLCLVIFIIAGMKQKNYQRPPVDLIP